MTYPKQLRIPHLPHPVGEPGVDREQPLSKGEVVILPPVDVMETVGSIRGTVTAAILDPWYNKGVGGVRNDYCEWLLLLLKATSEVSEHIFLWGFPEIVAPVVSVLPTNLELVAWLTWFYKNCPSVIRGWRSSQLACLHLARPKAKLYPEHFLNAAQQRLRSQGKLRYMPGPMSVIEASLLVGFVGRSERTGHPAQKPKQAIEPLILMTTQPGDIVLDPMCGSGTTGAVCSERGRRAVLCDGSEEYTEMAEQRLGIHRSCDAFRALKAWGLR
jgi:site-specific DNA-methyltransferase (adenine-specific)